jgi:hypothetical protein
MSITAYAPTAVVEKTLHVEINDYLHPASSFGKLRVGAYRFYANTTAPLVPARFGVQTISGLSNVDRFFTSAQLASGKINPTPSGADCGDEDNAIISPLCVDVRAGGYFPTDLRGLYNITGHGIDGTGQTIGFTLWTAAERRAAMINSPPTPAISSSPSIPMRGDEEMWRTAEATPARPWTRSSEETRRPHYGPGRLQTAGDKEFAASTNQVDLYTPQRFGLRYHDSARLGPDECRL